MDKWCRCLVLVAVMGSMAAGHLRAQTLPAAAVAENPEFAPVAKKRAAGIMADLKLADGNQAARVEQHVENFIVTTKNLHEGKNPPKGDDKKAALTKARETLYAAMDDEKLSDDQKLIIKNGLCANYYRINYDAFLLLVPTMKDEEKKQVHDILVEAFDDAIVMNSGDAKGSAFEKRRGKVNNYLSKQGYDLKALSVVRNEKLRNNQKPSTRPANTEPAK